MIPEADESEPTPPLRVLVVDDNRDAADTLAMLAEVRGAKARAVFRPDEALAAVLEWRPDLVLLDIGLPGMSGFEVAAHLRREGNLPRLVAVTGWDSPEDRERATLAGFSGHLIKPVSHLDVDRVLDDARLAAEAAR